MALHALLTLCPKWTHVQVIHAEISSQKPNQWNSELEIKHCGHGLIPLSWIVARSTLKFGVRFIIIEKLRLVHFLG